MKLTVEQVYPGQSNPTVLVSTARADDLDSLAKGMVLRCAGYRYTVAKVHGAKGSRQLGLELLSEFGVRSGMVLRPVDDPLSDEELASMLARMGYLLQQLLELEEVLVSTRMRQADSEDLLVEFLKKQGVFDEALRCFERVHDLKLQLPELKVLRKVGRAADQVNSKLGVIQLSKGE